MATHNVEGFSVVELAGVTAEATATVISNFAWQHLKAATLFREQTKLIESNNIANSFGAFFEEIRSYASATIMSSAAAMEAFINEIFISPNGHLYPLISDFENTFWGSNGIERMPTLSKYQHALKLLRLTSLDSKSQFYQDAEALIWLRNYLIHFKPSWDQDRPNKIKLINTLNGKYALSKFPDQGADFLTMKSMSAGCAEWAVRTTLRFLREFHAIARIEEDKMKSFWQLET